MEQTNMKMRPTDHEKAEWSRMAQDCYRHGLNAHGHRYSIAASLPKGASMAASSFDSLMEGYRTWLVFGRKELVR